MKSVEEIKKGLKNQSSNAKKSADAVKAGLVKNKIISDVNSLSASAQNNEGYSSLKSKATEIDNMLVRYRKYYDNDFISSVDSTISSTLKNSKKSIDVADALSNTDANSDGTVDLKDLVRAKKNENNSSAEVKEIKKLTTDEIKKELLSPEYTKERILKKAVEDAKTVYEEAKKTDDRSLVMKGLDFIGGVPNSVSNAKEDYEAKKKAYETQVAENTEKRIQKQYGVTGTEYIESLKQQKKNAKTDSEKETVSAKLKSTREKLYGETNVFKHIGNIAKEGILIVEKGIAASFDFVLGNAAKALGFENNPFTMTNKDYTNRLEKANAETVKSSKTFGDDDNLTGQAGTAIVAAIPDMLISLLTAGSSTATKGAQLGSKAIANANPTFLYNLQQGIDETVKSPIYYTSFIRELGTNYEDALANGATEEQAALVALFTSTVNSRIEMGGMQALPDELINTKGFGKKALKWLTSSADEGLEEVKQGAVSKLTDKAFYDYDKEVYSNTDSNAIIHPSSMGQEFAMGTLVGAVLGGGQLTFNGIIQANNDSQYKNIGKFVSKTNNVQELIDYGKSAVNDDIRVLARTVNAENITDADIGRLYQYAVRDITEKFDDVYTERDFETIVNEYFSGNVSESIKNIASATFANKLMEMNIELEQNSTYKAFNENTDLQSTTNAISNPLSSYSSERQGVIKSFLNSVDEKLKSFVQSVKNGDTTFRREKISDVSDRAVSDIKNLLGIDVSGYTNNINTSGIEHILKRHGEKGQHDSSMSSDEDIARVGWVLDNYDSVELLTEDGEQIYSSSFMDKENNPAPQIRFVKKIDGTYYVVEAAAENNYKKLWVQSAYLQKNNEDVTQVPDATVNGTPEMTAETALPSPSSNETVTQASAEGTDTNHGANARSALVSPVSNPNIPQNGNGVNNNISTGAENNSENGNLQSTAEAGSEIIKGKPNRKPLDKAEQDYILKIASALGREVKFVHLYDELKAMGKDVSNGIPDGAFDNKTGVIYIDFAAKDPILFVFKHELTHFTENTEQYKKFVEAVKKSKAFKEWLESKHPELKGQSFERLIGKSRQIEMDKRINDPDFNVTKAESEVIANFVGDVLFRDDGSKLESLLSSLDYKERNAFVQFIRDFVNYLKKKFAGQKDLLFEISRLEDNFNRALSEATATKKFPTNDGGVQYDINAVNITEADIKQNIADIVKMKPVSEMSGNEFSKGAKDLVTQVDDYFATFGYSVENSVLGDVDITARGAKDSIAHGIGRNKAVAFAAVPKVIESGKIIDYQTNWKNRGYDTVVLAAPVTINNAPYYEGVIVLRDSKTQRFYVHEVITEKRTDMSFKTGADNKIGKSGDTSSPSILSLLDKIRVVKENLTTEQADNNRDTAERAGGVDNNSGLSPTDNVSTDSIPDNQESVNNNSMQKSGNNSKNNLQFSFARADDRSLVELAEQMEKDGASRKEIWKEYGLIRDVSGKWIYEIDDSKMKIHFDGDALVIGNPEYHEYLALEDKDNLTSKELERVYQLENKLGREWEIDDSLLGNYVSHDELFKKYPKLKNVEISTGIFEDENTTSCYIAEENHIIISEKLWYSNDEEEIQKALIHEIQHAIQVEDEREAGVDIEYWNKRIFNGERLPSIPGTDIEATPQQAYYLTAGEIEARATENRLHFNEKKRRNNIPALGWNKAIVIGKETASTNSLKFSIPSNADYMSAVESGDTEAAQRMTDEAAKAAGYTERLYHQTGADFTEFNTENQKAGKYDWELPTGTFLKPTSDDIGLSGKKQMELYAKFQNPLKFKNRAEAQKFWKENVEGYAEAVGEIKKVNAEYREKVDNAEADVQQYINQWRSENPDASRREIYNDPDFQKLYDKQQDIVDEWDKAEGEASTKAKELIDSFIAENDYDGIILERDDDGKNRHTKSYIAFESAQMKSAEAVTYDDSGNVIPLSERFNAEQGDIRYSVPNENRNFTEEMNALNQQLQNGEISAADFKVQVDVLFEEAGEEYGTIKKGESVTGNENFDNPVPKSVDNRTKTRQYTRTVLEGGQLTEDMLSVTKEMILSGDLSYTPTSNEKNIAKANRIIQGGHAEDRWNKIANCEAMPDSGDIALGEALLKLAVERKDTVTVVKLTSELTELGTRLGRSVQALSLLKRMDGIGQLYYVQKAVNTLNNDLQKKYKKNPPTIVIDETLAQQLAASKTKADFEITYGAILNDIALQVPSTFLDKFNAWRYMAMLVNPLTHIGNFFGNVIFAPSVKIKDIIAYSMERGLKQEQRTKSVVIKKDYKAFAERDFEDIKEAITSGGKMNPKQSIADNKPIFKNKVLEGIRKFNFDMLEKEDIIFLKGHYKRALGGYLQARGVDLKTISPDVLQKAREYAILEAQKATFRDASKLANYISMFSNMHWAANIFVEGNLPFKKTPLNVTKRGVEYSPWGLITTIGKALKDLRSGDFTASQFIDGLSGNLTGVGIFMFGIALASFGIVRGGFGDEEDDFDELLGMQEYSIEIAGKSYTLDWAAPACVPFFMGVTVFEELEKEGNANMWNVLTTSMAAALEPIIELSMLSGINELIRSASYAEEDKKIQAIIGSTIGSYFSQLVPTIGGKLANLADPMRRTNYIDKTSPLPTWLQTAINTVEGKLPFASKLKAEYINAWGEKENKGNLAERFFQNFLSRGYISDIEIDEIATEIKRLAKATANMSVFPDTAPKYVKFKNVTKHLNRDDYEVYAVAKGQMSADYVKEAVQSSEYQSLTDEQKAEVITNLYAFANAKAKAKLSYTYEEISTMNEGVTEEMFADYSDKVKKAIVEEYFFQKFKKVSEKERNGGSAVSYYCKKAKED